METFSEEEVAEIKGVVDAIIEQAVLRCTVVQNTRERLNESSSQHGFPAYFYQDLRNSAESALFYNGIMNLPDFINGEEDDDERREQGDFDDNFSTLSSSDEEDNADTNCNNQKIEHLSPYYCPISNERTEILDYPLNVCEINKNNSKLLADGTSSLKAEKCGNKCMATPFTLKWCFGVNIRVPPIFLAHQQIFFTAAHIGVIYNYKSHAMKFLQGLTGEVSCTAFGGRYLAFADSGPDQTAIVLWDCESLQPQRCWLKTLPCGASLIHINPKGTHLTAISAAPTPLLVRWNLQNTHAVTGSLPAGVPKHLACHPHQTDKFIITFPQKIIIASCNEDGFLIQKSNVPKMRSKIGLYRQSCFTDLDNQIVTGTSLGQAIIWTENAEYIKMVQMHRAAITWLQVMGDSILIAHEDGTVWIHQRDLRVRSSFSLGPNPVVSLSFLESSNGPKPSEFALTTRDGKVNVVVTRQQTHQLFYNTPASIMSLDCHPSTIKFVTGDAQGKVTLYDLETEAVQQERTVLCCTISALAFAPAGTALAVGSAQGDFLMLDPILLTTLSVLPMARAAIRYIMFNNTGKLVTYIHEDSGVGHWKFTTQWNSRGKYKPHLKPVRGATLANEHRLFTVSEDRTVAEMNTKHMLRLVTRIKIEQTAFPTSCAWHEGQLLVANNDYKLRFIDMDTQQIIRTVRSPSNAPIHIMRVVHDKLIYAAGTTIGACKMPWRVWGSNIVAHPSRVTNICPFKTGLLTTGERDTVVFKWACNQLPTVTEQPTFPEHTNALMKRLFFSGKINSELLIGYLRLFGYFPTKFDISNILREIDDKEISEADIRQILWHHGPPPGIKVDDLRNALLTVSDVVRTSGPMVQTERLLEALTSGPEGLSREEAQETLRILSAPGLMPPHMHIKQFLTKILGVDPLLLQHI